MSKVNIYAYAGYKYEIPDKLIINFNSSYDSTNERNYPNHFQFVLGPSSVYLTYDEAYALHTTLKEMLELAEVIPNKDNCGDYALR